MKKYSPPKCPSCKEPLKRVWEVAYSTWDFNPKTGEYEEIEIAGELENKCANCENDILEIFTEGVCNFSKKTNK